MKFEFFADAVDTPPTRPKNPSVGYPSNGDPSTGRPATTPGAWFYYMLMVEFETLLTQNGIEPSAENLHQLADFFASYKEQVMNASTIAETAQKAAQDAARDAAASAVEQVGASVVQTLEQTLSDAQKLQARKNIGVEEQLEQIKESLSLLTNAVARLGGSTEPFSV